MTRECSQQTMFMAEQRWRRLERKDGGVVARDLYSGMIWCPKDAAAASGFCDYKYSRPPRSSRCFPRAATTTSFPVLLAARISSSRLSVRSRSIPTRRLPSLRTSQRPVPIACRCEKGGPVVRTFPHWISTSVFAPPYVVERNGSSRTASLPSVCAIAGVAILTRPFALLGTHLALVAI